jgi:hypothetical protein
MRSRATTFMHELLHISWGSAQVCDGSDACTDHGQDIGGRNVLTYKTGRAKLLAQRNVKEAAWNNDNLVYYSMAEFMEKKWGKYPQYPSAWDRSKSREENEDNEKKAPGWSDPPKALDSDEDKGRDYDPNIDGPPVNDPVYPPEAYPDWYKPVLRRLDSPNPDITQPESDITFNGPQIDDVVCDTTDFSAAIYDCGRAFGLLKYTPDLEVPPGKKGQSWWASVCLPRLPPKSPFPYHNELTNVITQFTDTCVIDVEYTEDWSNDCKATAKDVDDHTSVIYERCQNPGNRKIGGHVAFSKKDKKCGAEVRIKKKDGDVQIGLQPPAHRKRETVAFEA